MLRQGSRNPLACLRVVPDASSILPTERSFANEFLTDDEETTTKGLTGFRADRKVGRPWELSPAAGILG